MEKLEVLCQRCRTGHRLDEHKSRGKHVHFQCKTCGQPIELRPTPRGFDVRGGIMPSQSRPGFPTPSQVAQRTPPALPSARPAGECDAARDPKTPWLRGDPRTQEVSLSCILPIVDDLQPPTVLTQALGRPDTKDPLPRARAKEAPRTQEVSASCILPIVEEPLPRASSKDPPPTVAEQDKTLPAATPDRAAFTGVFGGLPPSARALLPLGLFILVALLTVSLGLAITGRPKKAAFGSAPRTREKAERPSDQAEPSLAGHLSTSRPTVEPANAAEPLPPSRVPPVVKEPLRVQSEKPAPARPTPAAPAPQRTPRPRNASARPPASPPPLDSGVALAALQKQGVDLQRCADLHLAGQHREQEVRVRAQMTVSDKGAVQALELSPRYLTTSPFGQCLRTSFQKVLFPTHPGGVAALDLPLTFQVGKPLTASRQR